MAITIKPSPSHSVKGPQRGMRSRTFLITPDASKPAGGYTILATDLGFTSLKFGICGDPAGAIYYAGIRIGTASSDATVQYYAATESAASLIGSAIGASVTGLTTNAVPLYVIGI